jgi:hypothetical protein
MEALAGIDHQTSQSYDAASAFNVLVTLGVTWCIYALGRIWTGDRWLALLMALLYSLLCNANVWIRHMVPYQESLLFSLLALWVLSVNRESGDRGITRVALGGLLTAFAYTCYPGHYAFVIINGVTCLALSRRRVRSAAAFSATFAAVMGVFEAVSRYGGGSYISDLRALSGSISMGDPREGYVFIWHYLRDVEGIVGVTLFALFGAFAALILWRRGARIDRAARVAIITAVACYLLHASMGVLAGKMVFYGRILAAYLPFLVGGAAIALANLQRRKLRRLGVGVLVATSAYSFVTFAQRYSQIVYPAEFLRHTMTSLGRGMEYPPNALWACVSGDRSESVESLDPALITVVDTRPDGSDVYVLLASHDEARRTGRRFIGVNLKFMWYFRERYDRFIPPEGYRLIAEALHPEVFPFTGYEGRRPWERERLARRQYTMRIYERVPDAGRMAAVSGTQR